jgi:hypothetical protein
LLTGEGPDPLRPDRKRLKEKGKQDVFSSNYISAKDIAVLRNLRLFGI